MDVRNSCFGTLRKVEVTAARLPQELLARSPIVYTDAFGRLWQLFVGVVTAVCARSNYDPVKNARALHSIVKFTWNAEAFNLILGYQ